MIKVIVCDDNPQVLDYYETLLTDTAQANGIELKLFRCASGEQLLYRLSNNPNSADIIYLDILMGKMNGLEAARKLREIGCLALIIYLTTSDEYVFEAFDVSPFYYIVKDEMPAKKFKEVFLKAVDAVSNKADDYYIVTFGATTTKIPLDRIQYFEIHNRLMTVHTIDTSIDFYSTLEDVEQTLQGKSFTRIHRSYLVNCHYIQKLTRTLVTLTDGTELPVSAKYTQSVQATFSDYLLKI